MKFATKLTWHYPPHLRHVAILCWESKKLVFYRHSADMEENANKLHFKCTDFNFYIRVTVYAECICVFLSKSCSCRWIPHWLLTNTAVTNFQCHKRLSTTYLSLLAFNLRLVCASIPHLSSSWNWQKMAGSRWTCFGVRVPRTSDYPTTNLNQY